MDYNKKREIGARMEKVRIEKLNGLSYVQIGKAIGSTGQNVSLFVKGYSAISLDKAIKFCDFAGVSMDYIFRGIDEKKTISVKDVTNAVREYNKNIK